MQEEARNLRKQVADAEANKAAKLQEFRDGQFCSGCNQTRSEILAKGESFPHSGQSVIRATPQQIAQKDAQLTAEIEKKKAALSAALKKGQEDERWLLECVSQLNSGATLWRVACEFERRALKAADATRDEIYRKRRDALVGQIDKAVRATKEETPGALFLPLIEDLGLWRDLIGSLVQNRKDERAAFERQYREAELDLLRELKGVTSAGSKILPLKNMAASGQVQLAMGTMDSAMIGVWSVGALGRSFRMGNYDPDQFGQVLPRVIAFVEAAEAFPPREARYDDFYLTGVQYQVDAAISVARERLRQSPFCSTEPTPTACS